ncbi:MAG: NAD(P)H-dependent oxidoreductase [Pseudomonadota bacterium]
MTKKTITLILGHPDKGKSFCRALAEAYQDGATKAGHTLHFVDIAHTDFPLITSKEEYEAQPAPNIVDLQEKIKASQHLVMIFPMWMGSMPARLKGLIEQIFRPGFALGDQGPKKFPKPLMKGKSAHIIMTMGMPAAFYRLYFRAHGLKTIERNLLGFAGFKPIKSTLIGGVDNAPPKTCAQHIEKIRHMGTAASL